MFGHTHKPFISEDGMVANTGYWVCDPEKSDVQNTYLKIENGAMELNVRRTLVPLIHVAVIGAAGFHGSIGFIGAMGVERGSTVGVGVITGFSMVSFFSGRVTGVGLNDGSLTLGSVRFICGSGIIDPL